MIFFYSNNHKKIRGIQRIQISNGQRQLTADLNLNSFKRKGGVF